MRYDGGRVRKNPKALIGSLAAIIVVGGIVFWVVANALRENVERPPELGRSHAHSEEGGQQGGGMPAAPVAGPDARPSPGGGPTPTPAPTVDLTPKGGRVAQPNPEGG